MLRRKKSAFRHNQIAIFDYKMFSVTVLIGGLSALGLAYMLKRSCVADSPGSQTAFVKYAAGSPSSGEEILSHTQQKSQEFVFKYSDGSLKKLSVPSDTRETAIRSGIMLRHTKARQGI